MSASAAPAIPPPQYTDSPSPTNKSYGATPAAEPLLEAQRAAGAGVSRNAWIEGAGQDETGSNPDDDFKYGVNVADSDLEIRVSSKR